MNFLPMHDITTSRLILRKITMADLENYHHRLTSDPKVAEHMLWNANPDIAHTRATIQRILEGYKAGTRYHWGIALKEDDSLIGTIALVGFEEAQNTCSFAYMLGQEFWGKGYGTEALKAVLSFAFAELGVSQVIADHFAENTPSGIVMEKVGMEKTGLLPRRYEKNGIFHDTIQYRICKTDEGNLLS